MLRFRTIRQRRHRARAAQVAAVATVFGLMLVVTFISAFVLQPLPSEMTAIEYTHMLQVENQLSRLQAMILAQASSSERVLTLSSPVTLGSGSVPPWSQPSQGAIQPEGGSIRAQESYQISQVVAAPPVWNTGSSCLVGGGGQCSGNGNIDRWNETFANHSAFTVTITGSSNSLQYNISGNNDTVTISWTGGDTGFVNFIVNGSDDSIVFNKGGSDTTSPTMNFYFYGQRDKFNFNPSGSHSSKGGMRLNVVFVGTLSEICPYGNLSSSDTLGTLSSGGSNLAMSVTWWNALGYVSGPTKVTYPGGGSSNETITFSNNTGVVACAFTKTYSSQYTSQYFAGVVVDLENHYSAPAFIAYDQGAVVQSVEGGTSTMVSGPQISYEKRPYGYAASVTLVNIEGNFSTSAGVTTAAVTTQVVGVQSYSVVNGNGSLYLSTPIYLNITTAFPQAWSTFFSTLAPLIPGGATCTSSVTYPAPYSCLQPPVGAFSHISAALDAQEMSLTTITVVMSVL